MKKFRTYNGGNPSPVRNIGSSKAGKQTTVFPSRKNGSSIICESRLEADACLAWEQDQTVVRYYAQPTRLHVVVKEKRRSYTPDFAVIYDIGKTRFVEVKPDTVLENQDYLALAESTELLLESQGHQFQLLTSKDIRRQPRLKNLKAIYHQSHRVGELEMAYLRDTLSVLSSPIQVRTLLNRPAPPSARAIAAAIFNGELQLNWDVPYTENSWVYWG
jgi:hypothetical protein